MCVTFFKDVYLDSLGVKQYVVCVIVNVYFITTMVEYVIESLKNSNSAKKRYVIKRFTL